MAKQLKKVRWGHVHELDRRLHVGSTKWKERLPNRLKHLSAWRYLHLLGRHKQIQNRARRKGVKPSSDLTLRQKIKVARDLGG